MVKYKKLNVNFLQGIIPETWTETVYESDKHYLCDVKGEEVSQGNWKKLFEKLRVEFGDKFMEVYSITDHGIHFEVYLKKD